MKILIEGPRVTITIIRTDNPEIALLGFDYLRVGQAFGKLGAECNTYGSHPVEDGSEDIEYTFTGWIR